MVALTVVAVADAPLAIPRVLKAATLTWGGAPGSLPGDVTVRVAVPTSPSKPAEMSPDPGASPLAISGLATGKNVGSDNHLCNPFGITKVILGRDRVRFVCENLRSLESRVKSGSAWFSANLSRLFAPKEALPS